jgi:hypothetical protein
MPYRIRVLGVAGSALFDSDLMYWLAEADVEDCDGRGSVSLSRLPGEALTFPSQSAAMEFWRRQSTRRPLRFDGRPNRPLTAFTVAVEAAESYEEAGER